MWIFDFRIASDDLDDFGGVNRRIHFGIKDDKSCGGDWNDKRFIFFRFVFFDCG